MEGLKVYKVLGIDWVATKQSKEETLEWYRNTYGEEVEESDIEELDLDTDLWDVLSNEEENKLQELREAGVEITKAYGDYYKKSTVRKVLQREDKKGTIEYPFIVASNNI